MADLERLLTAVQGRVRLASMAGVAWRAWLVCAALLAVLILASRLLGVAPGWAHPALLLVALAMTGLAGWLGGRDIDRRAAARLADVRLGSDDLLLTASELPASPSGLGAVVQAQAAARCATADPRAIVPWQPWRRLAWAAVLAVLLLAATLWLPQFDPFDHVRQQRLRDERLATAEAAQLAAERRLAAVLAEKPEAEHSAAVEGALDDLLATLGERSADRTARLQALDAQRRTISAALERTDERALPEQAERSLQRVGGLDPASVAGLRQALAGGEAEQVKRALEQAAELAKRMPGMEPAAKAAAQRELKQQLDELSRALAGGGAAAQAVQQALDRLAEAADPALAQAAMESLQAELELAEAAADGLAQGGRDREALKQALETLRLAKACAQCQGGGEGEGEGGKPGSLADYKAMFQKLLDGEAGSGQGMGPNQGQGQGGVAEEEPGAKTDFTDERSRSQQTAGKIVASWQAPGAQERGTVVEAYRERLSAARREASDAVGGEDLPPAYREAVKAYFDDLAPAKE